MLKRFEFVSTSVDALESGINGSIGCHLSSVFFFLRKQSRCGEKDKRVVQLTYISKGEQPYVNSHVHACGLLLYTLAEHSLKIKKRKDRSSNFSARKPYSRKTMEIDI